MSAVAVPVAATPVPSRVRMPSTRPSSAAVKRANAVPVR